MGDVPAFSTWLQKSYEKITKRVDNALFFCYAYCHNQSKKGNFSVNRSFKRIFSLIIACALFIGFAQTVLAADFRTTSGVNLRSGPSTDANVVRTVDSGSTVEMLQHDPAEWSRVRINGTTGYIRSDFLALPSGTTANFRTTAGVNLRSSPSTDADVLRAVNYGAIVEVLSHDPDGWSRAMINGTTGYIRSDFLAFVGQSAAPAASAPAPAPAPVAQSQTSSIFRTTVGVNFRNAPSTDAGIIRVLNAGTTVEVLTHNQNGWSNVRQNGTVGYIMSEFLTEGAGGGGNVEFLEWSTARNIVRNGVPMRVVDVRTGISFYLQSFSIGGHADVEPLTQADTDAIFQSRNGVWAWAPRPVWVTIGNRTIAAALNGMPHGGSTISGNGMNGHLCLHFYGTRTRSQTYQRDLNNAVREAWYASK